MFYLDVQFKSTLDFASHIELPYLIRLGTSISGTNQFDARAGPTILVVGLSQRKGEERLNAYDGVMKVTLVMTDLHYRLPV